jgi:hypothetical protein
MQRRTGENISHQQEKKLTRDILQAASYPMKHDIQQAYASIFQFQIEKLSKIKTLDTRQTAVHTAA